MDAEKTSMYQLSLKPILLLLYMHVRDSYKEIPPQSEIEQILKSQWGDMITGIVNYFQITEQKVLQVDSEYGAK